jgi:hypothetical protein
MTTGAKIRRVITTKFVDGYVNYAAITVKGNTYHGQIRFAGTQKAATAAGVKQLIRSSSRE